MMEGFALVFLCLLACVVGLLWRATWALERMARHQLEITRDVKRLADASEGEEE
jgi:hypothetical protein